MFGVPLRVYQQTTGQILPVAITNALQYVRMNAGKCEGLFRKPGVKSKIDRLRAQIETTDTCHGESAFDTIKFDDYQPFVVADVIRQYFRELPECLMPPSITRLLCDLIKCKSAVTVRGNDRTVLVSRRLTRRSIVSHTLHVSHAARRNA